MSTSEESWKRVKDSVDEAQRIVKEREEADRRKREEENRRSNQAMMDAATVTCVMAATM